MRISFLLTEEEMDFLLKVFEEARGDEGYSEEEEVEVLAWAAEARMNLTLLNSVLSGLMAVNVIDGEVVFGATEKGQEVYDKAISKAVQQEIDEELPFLLGENGSLSDE